MGLLSQFLMACATFKAVTALHCDAWKPINSIIARLASCTSSSFSA